MSPVLSCAKVTPLFSFAQAGSDQAVCLPCSGSPDLHRINRAGHGRVPLPESTLQSKHDLGQVNPMFVRKLLFAQHMVRIQVPPVMSRTKRNRREIRSFLPYPPGAQRVRVGTFDRSLCPPRSAPEATKQSRMRNGRKG